MRCPRCGRTYGKGRRDCPSCNVPLADERYSAAPDRRLLDAASPGQDIELVTVFTSSSAIKVDIAESILRSAEVEFMTKGKNLQGLFGWGGFPAGNSLAMGPMQILVRREDAADAAALLEDLVEGDREHELDWSDEDWDPDEDEAP